MDLSRYDEPIVGLLNDCVRQMAVVSPKAARTLQKIKKIAEERDDIWLRGFAHFYHALYLYYTEAESGRYRALLNRAVYWLLRSDDKEMLARTYNFVAVDAHNNGSFDIAYNYYMMALRFSEEVAGSRSASLIETNIGRLFSELGDHKQARRHIRLGIRALRRQKDDLRHVPNLVIASVNDGITSLALKDVPAAERTLAEIEKLIRDADETTLQEVLLPCIFLRARLAFTKGEKEKAAQLTKELTGALKKEPVLQELIDDIRGFCNAMLEAGMPSVVGEVVRAVDRRIMSCGVTHVMRIFTEIKVDYYEAKGDRKRLTACLHEQHELLKKQREEQQRMSRSAVDLVNLVDGLRSEQERVRKENAALQVQALTDALTVLPNRYALNNALEDAFARATEQGSSVGVGILDIDYFKEYNDHYGHPAGDRCLKKVARILMRFARQPGVFCARYGGDEFVLIYEGKTDAEIRREARKIGASIASAKIIHEDSLISDHVTVSQGFYNGRPKAKTKPWDYLAEADAALYAMKKKRRKSPG